MRTEQLAIVTCSFAPDAQRCRRLCRSVDRFVPETVEHCLIVPRRDYSLFADLNKGRRRVRTTEDVVPGGFRQLPVSSSWWSSPCGWPVRGWIMQQITKLSANHAMTAELILFADSDLTFIRPFEESMFYRKGRLRLHRIPGAGDGGEHLRWHHRAGILLDEAPRYFGSDYVGQLITWRRSHLIALKAHIERAHGIPWHQPVSQSLKFSEYILYGAYVEHVLDGQSNGHFYCAEDPCHCCWFSDDAERLGNGSAVINPHAQAILLQSNLGMKTEEETALFTAAQRLINPVIPDRSLAR